MKLAELLTHCTQTENEAEYNAYIVVKNGTVLEVKHNDEWIPFVAIQEDADSVLFCDSDDMFCSYPKTDDFSIRAYELSRTYSPEHLDAIRVLASLLKSQATEQGLDFVSEDHVDELNDLQDGMIMDIHVVASNL